MPIRTVRILMPSTKRRQSSGQDSGLTPKKKIVPKVTTPTTSISMEQKIDQLLDMMRGVQGDVKDIKETLTEHQKSIEYAQKDIEDLQKKTSTNELATKELLKEVSECRKELQQCKADITYLKDQVINQEAYSRRENLIFSKTYLRRNMKSVLSRSQRSSQEWELKSQ